MPATIEEPDYLTCKCCGGQSDKILESDPRIQRCLACQRAGCSLDEEECSAPTEHHLLKHCSDFEQQEGN